LIDSRIVEEANEFLRESNETTGATKAMSATSLLKVRPATELDSVDYRSTSSMKVTFAPPNFSLAAPRAIRDSMTPMSASG
jgi:hypothetical protein